MENNYKILIIEDDDKLRNTLKEYFEAYHFTVFTAANGEDGLSQFYENSQNLNIIVLDGMLPGIDGYDVLDEIRNYSDIPIIMVTARESEEDHLTGYRKGADGYITKPFLMSVLKEQALAFIKRYSLNTTDGVKKGALYINTASRQVYINEKLLNITLKEYELLLLFIRNEKICLTRDQILNSVWGVSYDGDIRTVDTHVKQLRKKLTDEYPYIKSVYGVGYRFEVE